MNYFITLIFIIFGLSLKAQHDHGGGNHGGNENTESKYMPQHGGEIIEIGKYKLEIIINPMLLEDKLTVYVLKNNHKEMPLDKITCSAIFSYENNPSDTLTLSKSIDKFTSNNIHPAQKVNIIFNLVINKKAVSGVYFYKGLIKN